jgi:hypothetical protein
MDKGAQQEFDARANALITQATQTGVSSTLVDDYAKVIEAYKNGEKAYSEVLKVQK